MERVGVDAHPDLEAHVGAYPEVGFEGSGLLTNHPFDLAYRAAVDFAAALKRRTKAAGFIRTLVLQSICSSFASGRATAEEMLRREILDDEEQTSPVDQVLGKLTVDGAGDPGTLVEELSRPEARDPKTAAVGYFLTGHRNDGKAWLEHGCIVFSQYFDTVRAIAGEL